jgi:hypothetical protein
MKRTRCARASLLALFALTSACGDEGAQGQAPLDEQLDEIINGTTPADGSLQARGVVRVTFGGGSCSGTLLSNQFVLTARHCVRQWLNPGWGDARTNIQARLEGPDNVDQTSAAAAVWENNGNPAAGDFAVFLLSQPVTIGGRSDALYNPIYSGTDASLLNQSVFCAGYGNNALASVGPPPAGGTGAGTLRTANLTVTNTAGNVLTFSPNTQSQIVGPGDSGSTCFFNNQITGVASTCSPNPAGPGGGWVDVNGDGQATSNEYTSILSCAAASPNAHRTWTNGIVLADVSIVPFTFSPPLSSALSARLTAINGVNFLVDAKASSLFPALALRSGWHQISIPNEPARTMCGVTRGVTPVTGAATLRGACLSDGLVANLVGRTFS